MKFPPIQLSNVSDKKQLVFLLNSIFGEENAVASMDNYDGGIVVHFNQDLPMTARIENFYIELNDKGKITL